MIQQRFASLIGLLTGPAWRSSCPPTAASFVVTSLDLCIANGERERYLGRSGPVAEFDETIS